MTSALAAEWTKLRTQPAVLWLTLGVVVTTVGVGVATGVATHVSNASVGGDSTKMSLVGVSLGQLMIAVLAITAVTEEYATGMLRTTFAAMPNRICVLAAKAAGVAAVAASSGAVAVAGSLIAGRALLPGAGVDPAHGYALVSLAHAVTIRAAVGTVVYLTLIGLLSLGLATLIRDTAASIGVVFGLLFIPELIAHVIGGAAGRHIQQVSPMTAGLAIQATTRTRSLVISPWLGLTVCAAWAVTSLACAVFALRTRDP